MAEKRNVKMRCHQRSKNEDCERAISEVAQEMQTGTRTGEQLTEQVRLILSRETTGEVDSVGEIRHGYEIG